MNYTGHRKLAPLLALGLMFTASAAVAQGLQSLVTFQVVEADANGVETMVERSSVRPGETIQYAIEHTNHTDESLSGIVVVAPIPSGATFAYDSDRSSVRATFEIQAEMDPENEGLEWSTLPATRLVPAENGGFVSEPVPETAISAVRWTLARELESGAASLNTYRVTVD